MDDLPILRRRCFHTRRVSPPSKLSASSRIKENNKYSQVRNLTHAIKAACDFVSPQNLARTVDLASSLRAHRVASGSGEDFLQLQTLIWFGWVAMCLLEDDRAKGERMVCPCLIVSRQRAFETFLTRRGYPRLPESRSNPSTAYPRPIPPRIVR